MSPSNDPSTPQPALLTPQYAPASLALPWYRRRSFRRGIFAIILILIGLVISYVYRDLPRYWKLSRLQDRCLQYVATPDQIVYSEIPADIAKLPATSPEYALDLSVTPSNVFHRPHCLVGFENAIRFSSPAYPVLFLGERSNAGQRRLICILFGGWPQMPHPGRSQNPALYQIVEPIFGVVSYDIARLNGLPNPSHWAAGGRVSLVTSLPEPVNHLRIFAGQRDPADSSRFTINYQANDKPGVIEGQLEPNGSVSLRIKDGPLKAAPGIPADLLVP